MMEGSVQFCLLVALLFAAPNPADAQKKYFKLGGSMPLKPPVSGAITSIVWKSNGNLVAEHASGVPLTYYGSFNGRTTLNTETGELVINNMIKSDSGEYVVEINNKVLPQRFEAVEIKDVPKPVVVLRPLACGSTSSDCNLLCDGDIKESGPVTFYWRMGDGEWKESKQDMDIINDEETKKVEKFSCRMKNPVSEKDSEPERNPFIGGNEPSPSGDSVIGTVVGVLVPLVMLVVILALLYWKREDIMNCVRQIRGKKQDTTDGQDETAKLNEIHDIKVDAENGGAGAGHGDGGAGHGGTDAGHSDGDAGHADAGAGHGDGDAGHGDGDAGHGGSGAGHGDGGAGHGDGGTGNGGADN